MIPAVIFGVLSLVFFVLFVYYLDLLFFFFREKKKFKKNRTDSAYLEKLEKRHRRCKHPQKNNFLLYLICLSMEAQGKEKKAKNLFPLVKKDYLLGIDK